MSAASENTGYRFSWGLVLAGAAVACAVTLFLLTLGAGIGLLLVNPESGAQTPPAFLTGGAIYFFVVQAFGFAAGGHVAGRLLGPLRETFFQEEIRAALHGLVVWSAAVLGTVAMIALGGATTAALYGAVKPGAPPDHVSAVVVDRLFRPATATPASDPGAARGEAGRLLDAAFAPGSHLTGEDRSRLVQLVQQQTGASAQEAATRVAHIEKATNERMRRTAEMTRKLASCTSLWLAFSLLFGGLVAMVAAVTARLEDDQDSPWSLFAFHRGWKS